ncbi:hypothetical protein GCM10027321_43470 [Massilia terrae]
MHELSPLRLSALWQTPPFATISAAKMKLHQTVLALAAAFAAAHASAADPYFRFPAIRGDTVVFTAEGDLWRTSVAGGKAQRLTTHPAAETNAALSFDGKLVAFTAAYEGAQEAYVMPLDGGLPKRLTFENGNVLVLGWTPQGEVLVSTENTTGPARHRVIAAIDPQNMARRVLPLADANDAVLDDAGRTVYFTRMGLAMTGDHVKNYRGGAHAQLWRFELSAKREAELLFANDAGNNSRPMWWKGRLYFISDASGSDNLWSSNPDGGDRKQLTQHKDWDVRSAALGDGRIVYQLGADLHVLDIAAGGDRLLKASLVSDFDQQRTRLIRSPLDALTDIEIANKTERIVLTARGHVTVAGLHSQRRVEIAVPEGARARGAVFSHDDKTIYAIVDSSGENEIWRYAADGSGHGEQLTRDGAGNHRWALYPSPDGKWIAHTDKHGRTWLLELASGKNVVIDDAGKVGLERSDQVVWSPDSRNVAFVRAGSAEQRNQIGMYNLDTRDLAFVTTDRYTASSPAFSPDGKWLYFLSARHFNVGNGSVWADRDMGPVFDKRVGVFALALQSGSRFPFKPDDELSKPEEKPAADSKSSDTVAVAEKVVAAAMADAKAAPKAEEKKPKLPPVEYAGLRERLYEVPLAPGNYSAVAVDDKRLYLLESDGRRQGTLKTLAISRTAPQPEVFVANVRDFGLTDDRKHVFYRTASTTGPGEMLFVDAGAKAPTDLTKARVKVDDWTIVSNPRLEWKQMFNDALAHAPRLPVRQQDARHRLERGQGALRAAGRSRHGPRGAGRRAGHDDRRSRRAALAGAPGRYPPSAVRRRARGTGRRADPRRRRLPRRPHLPQRAGTAGRARPAGGAGREREGGRHHRLRQRPRADRGARHRRRAAQPGRPPDPADSEAPGRHAAQGDRHAGADGAPVLAALRRLGAEPRSRGGRSLGRQDRLPAPARDGADRYRLLRAQLLRQHQQGRPDHRRPPQQRRQHRQLDRREAAAQGLDVLDRERQSAAAEHAEHLPRAPGGADRPDDLLGRRDLLGRDQGAEAGAAGGQAHGRRWRVA